MFEKKPKKLNRKGKSQTEDEQFSNGKVVSTVATIFDYMWFLIKYDLIYICFCLPIVTIPSATTALYRTTCVKNDGQTTFLWDEFWTTFKKELFVSLPIGVLSLLGIGLPIYVGLLYLQVAASSPIFVMMLAAAFMTLVLALFMSPYLFLQQAFVKLSFGAKVKNAFILSFSNLPKNFALLLIKALLLLVIWKLNGAYLILIILLFSFNCFCECKMLNPIIQKILLPNSDETRE
ncbi:MAG: DUF624 domain-containing protein [Clostridia bacterium]